MTEQRQKKNTYLSASFWIAPGIFAAVFLLMSFTSRILPLGWDEGEARWRADAIVSWVDDLNAKPLSESFSESEIKRSWMFISYREGHPAFYGIVCAAGEALGRILPGCGSRTFFLLFYAAAAAGAFCKIKRITESPLNNPEENQNESGGINLWTSCAAGIVGVLCLILIPRLFAHAHFSVNDSILTSCWLLAWVFFTLEEKPASAARAIPFGLFLGLTMASKFTGFLAIPCFLLAGLIKRNRAMTRYLICGLTTACVVFYLVNPPLWHDPISGMGEFFHRNLNREESFNLTGYFFGSLYNITYSLPWWNSITWVLITVPVGILILVWFGLRQLWADRRRLYAPVLGANAAVLLVVRALPGAPAHDNERLIISAFAFLAIIAGLGAGRALRNRAFDWFHNSDDKKIFKRFFCTELAIALIFLGSLSSWLIYAPHWLSYYNLAVGGLPGAYRLGLEPTYWWTDLDEQTLRWINDNSRRGEKVRFQACSVFNLNLLIEQKKLRVNFALQAPGKYRWYVMQTRPSLMSQSDWNRAQSQTPVYTLSIPFAGFGPWNLQSVPLIRIYKIEP